MSTLQILDVPDRDSFPKGARISKKYAGFQKLITELKKRAVPEEIIIKLNEPITALNALPETDKAFARTLRKSQNAILNRLEKELKLVPKNHYRTRWTGLGMTVFGVPIGIALSTGVNNYGMLGAGIAIGLGIGLAIGNDMDRKAHEEGRQLDCTL
jgi:hypothetical protein